ncbi:MAG: N-acetylmuramoyl-L-alanine amidase, partial [Defluviitaleaceae bacterium]|nr:N-acetylmuramoyl-L-alanine amidase [Defluviitaleaceae bacterium]
MPKIAIYAGHGGSDPGAIGNGLLEKDLNLAVSNAASRIMRQWGYTVINNRLIDVNRDITADAIYANENRMDALVEIHQNYNAGAPYSGSEVFYSIRDTGKGRELAQSVLNQLVKFGFKDNGIKTRVNAAGQDMYAILRLTHMPAILVECAFINNPYDMAMFNVNGVAMAIAEGIRAVFPLEGGPTPPFPGGNLQLGSVGEAVRQVQRCLNNIAVNYPSIPKVAEDGVFGVNTLLAVVTFQQLFGLTPDGVVGPMTWNVMMSLCGSGGGGTIPPYPGASLRIGSVGEDVRRIQRCLNNLSNRYPEIPTLAEDGSFGNATHNAVVRFQTIFGLTPDGVVGPMTWERLMNECYAASHAMGARRC